MWYDRQGRVSLNSFSIHKFAQKCYCSSLRATVFVLRIAYRKERVFTFVLGVNVYVFGGDKPSIDPYQRLHMAYVEIAPSM